ncbi:MAG TPA: alcohol dehydrogenase catalytic domain-containing protein [Acidimicrobiales bacterium]|nr:alcohol dehydrogenase catalytic domain-containing protein [Acidimicrobiales bacterium]
MLAMVYTAPLELQMLEVEDPVPGEGELLVEVEAAGICGSELEGFASESPFRIPPLIMGHEFAGRRVDDGSPVVINPIVSCGSCDLCRRGLPNVCRRRQILGIQRSGGFAERVAVPAANCYPMPAAMAATTAALVEPLANAIHAMRLALGEDPLPLSVGVIGAGPLGFFSALTAKDHGIGHVAVADRAPERRELATATGADVVSESLEGEFDVVLDAVGSAATRAASVQVLRPGGTAVWIGLHGPEAGFDGQALIRQEKRVLGTFAYSDLDFRVAIERAARLSPGWVATRPLAEGIDAFHELLGGDLRSIKTLLVP